jgi:glycosyltransferase involved in cell wall biosynthesis
MGSHPTVSVIINCYNGEKYLREAIDSVYAQTSRDWEIVFWDDASTDGSAAIARSYDTRLRYFRSDLRIPLYAARNRALQESRGEIIGFLDADDAWLSTKLERQVPLFASGERVGLVYSNVELLDQDGGRRQWYQRRQPSGRLFSHLLRHYHLALPTVLVRRRAIEDVGPFDETMMVSGDADLFLRICHDWEAAYFPEVTARYREHADSLTWTRPELFLHEGDQIVQKLAERYPGFRTEFAHELVGFRAIRQKAYVFGLWRAGDNVRARSLARQYVRSAWSMAVLWWLSLLPYRLVKPLRETRGYAWWRRLRGR